MNQVCSTCSHPEHQAINAALAAGTTFSKLTAKFGISKSSLSRHSRKCLLRTRENKFRGRRVPIKECRQFVWFDSTCPVEFQNTIPPDIMKRDDVVIIRVGYEPRITDDYGRYLHPDRIHEFALHENEQRDAEKAAATEPPSVAVS